MSKWTELAMRVQSIAQAGRTYGENEYDRERYEELWEIAAEMFACETEVPVERVKHFFDCETGYLTPKIDTRAAVFKDGKILLVHEKNGTWALPGGWCEVNESVASNAVKETKEEAGLDVTAERIIAVQDWRKHNDCDLPYGVMKVFVLCKAQGNEAFHRNAETVETGYFSRDELPDRLANNKSTAEQIRMCFDANESECWEAVFD